MTTTARLSIAAVFLLIIATVLLMASGLTSGAQAAVSPDLKLGVALEYPRSLADFETSIGRSTDMFLWYQSISESLDTATLGPIAQGGRTIELAWEPWDYGAPDLVNQPAYQLRDITRGDFDADIHRWAREIKAFGYPVLFRPMSEMNGDWTSWSGSVNGNLPSDYIPAWRHIHDIFVAEGAANASFLWSPNRDGDSASATSTFTTYYPGDAYVDYVGIDGYNWGTMYRTPEWTSSWQSFEEVFRYSYDAFTTRTARPVIISETASTELGGDKAAWISDAFATLPARFPRVIGLTWFNYNKETDWRVNSSPASLEAFRHAVAVTAEPVPPPAEPTPPPADITAPAVSIASPAPGAVLYRRATVSAAATDDVGVAKVELYVGSTLVATRTSSPYTFYLNLRQFPNGSYMLKAKAYDAAGNYSESMVPVTILSGKVRR